MVMIYRTTRSIDNPIGDGRHDRAKWQTALRKSSIPAGFVFAVNEDGSIEDRNTTPDDRRVKASEAEPLRKALLAVAGPALGGEVEHEETVEEVVESLPPGAVAEILKALKISPKELRARLASEGSAPVSPTVGP
jgi:hypothetical protein